MPNQLPAEHFKCFEKKCQHLLNWGILLQISILNIFKEQTKRYKIDDTMQIKIVLLVLSAL